MGAKLCSLRHPIADQNFTSPSAGDGRSGWSGCTLKSLKSKNQRRCSKIFKRKIEMETTEKKIPKLTLGDWILASPGLKTDYLMRDELSACKQSKKKVHPCSSQSHGSLLAETKDSLCLERPTNRHEEREGMSSCSSITRNLIGKSQKRVSFKLPHIVICYTPEEPYCKEASLPLPEEQEPYRNTESEDSFSSSILEENSFDSAEEPFFRLAVDILPHVFVSSKIV